MKRFVAIYILPFIIALAGVYFIAINKQANNFLFKGPVEGNSLQPNTFIISNFVDRASDEEQFLKSNDTSENIYLLGSSELSNSTPAIPYNFISNHFKTKVIGVGHAGNQCLSIYAQLLANENRLNNAPIVIIVSPGWFESRASKGTSSEVFLEYASEKCLNKILKNKNNSVFDAYLFKRISQLYDEFSSPGLELKLMNFYHLSLKSFIHKAMFSPLIGFDKSLLSLKEKIIEAKNDTSIFYRHFIISEDIRINWDSLYLESRAEVIKNSSNNNLGIANDYYTNNIHNNKGGHIEAVAEKYNRELQDFRMLMKLLKDKKVNARLIISPLNVLYYKNLMDILPAMEIVEDEISKSGFPCFNMFETDKAHYDKAILNDVMHISDYGWYKIDHFIINTYRLQK